MRIVIVSDAWLPQVNGVVRTLMRTVEELGQLGHGIRSSPRPVRSFPCPTYPRSDWRCCRGASPADRFFQLAPSISRRRGRWAWRRNCASAAMPFTTAFHTRFPNM
jgi:hypothetical protein